MTKTVTAPDERGEQLFEEWRGRVQQEQSDGGLYVATCPEFDVVTQGSTMEEARDNLKEAVELFLECASPAERAKRFRPAAASANR